MTVIKIDKEMPQRYKIRSQPYDNHTDEVNGGNYQRGVGVAKLGRIKGWRATEEHWNTTDGHDQWPEINMRVREMIPQRGGERYHAT